MIDYEQFRIEILQPVLKDLGFHNHEGFEMLMMGTLAHESLGGSYLKQIKGPALGVFQMEPGTHDTIWNNYLSRNPDLASRLMFSCKFAYKPTSDMLVYNLRYSTYMAAIHYLKQDKGEFIQYIRTIEQAAEFWKIAYNTKEGKGEVNDFLLHYDKYKNKKTNFIDSKLKSKPKEV